jgi:Arc/MetJ-type ribon-helix-helix transcriptional regulator
MEVVMAKPMLAMKNVTIRLPKEQIQHIKKRAKDQRHYNMSKVVRRLVEADMAGQAH